MDSNENFLELDLKSMYWTKAEDDKSEVRPQARDDHSFYHDKESNLVYVFGGYVSGGKSYDLWKYDLEQN